jgi:hypothetical protein
MPLFRLPGDLDDLAMLSIDNSNAEFDYLAFDSTIYEQINGGNASQFHSLSRGRLRRIRMSPDKTTMHKRMPLFRSGRRNCFFVAIAAISIADQSIRPF